MYGLSRDLIGNFSLDLRHFIEQTLESQGKSAVVHADEIEVIVGEEMEINPNKRPPIRNRAVNGNAGKKTMIIYPKYVNKRIGRKRI